MVSIRVSVIIRQKFHLRVASQICKGPSIYDVHTEGGWGSGSGGRGGGSSPMWTSTQKIKIRVH